MPGPGAVGQGAVSKTRSGIRRNPAREGAGLTVLASAERLDPRRSEVERRAGLPPHPPGHMGLVPSPMFKGLAFQHPTGRAAIVLPYGIYSSMQSTQEKIPSTPGLSPPGQTQVPLPKRPQQIFCPLLPTPAPSREALP